MAEAIIELKTIAEDAGLKKFNKALAEGEQKAKDLQKSLKEMEKSGKATEQEMAAMRQTLNETTQANKVLKEKINATTREITQQAKASSDLKDKLSTMISDKLGVDISGLTSKLSGGTASMVALATAAITASKVLIDSARDVTALSNQFISFAGNAQGAMQMYDKFNDVARNMSSSYNEQQIYDMAKGLMSIGMNADEAADAITKAADVSAAMGKNAEFTQQMVDVFAKLKTGVQITEKEYKALALAGLDLTDIQDQLREGGVAGFEALRGKCAEYNGAMSASKQTAAEMEADISANMTELLRSTARLIDEFFGFSEMLRGFYQWIIEATGAAVNSIKSMVATLRNAKATANAYGEAATEWEQIYGDIWEKKRDQYASGEQWEAERAAAQAAYANATADVVVETEQQKQQAIEETTQAMRAQVKSIAKVSGGGSGGGRSGGGSGGAAKVAKEVDPEQERQKEIQSLINATNIKHQLKMTELENDKLIDAARADSYAAEQLQELETYKATLEQMLQIKELTDAQKLTLEQNLQTALQGLNKKTTDTQKEELTGVQQYYRGLAMSFSNAMAQCITEAKSFGDAFKQIIQQIIQQLISAVMYAAILAAFGVGGTGSFAGNFSKNFKGVLGFADGGLVLGAGSSRSDSINARLSNGEYVLNADAVKRIGVGNLNRMNYGTNAGHFADGGAVGGSASNITLNVSTIDGQNFADFLARGGLSSIKQALTDDDRMFNAAAGVW